MKKHILILLLISCAFFFYSVFKIFINNYDSRQNIVTRGINIYTKERVEKMQFDEYWLLYKVNQKTGKVPEKYLSFLRDKYKENPLKRLIDKNEFIQEIRFDRSKKNIASNDFYIVRNIKGNIGTSDKILLKALYCDKVGYEDYDFHALSTMRKNVGDYHDTHYLLGLLFLKNNGCHDKKLINKEIQKTASIITKRENSDKKFSDLFTERIVLLYWSGFGSTVKKDWIERIENNFSKSYGWTDKGMTDFYAHTHGLSLLALIYYAENKPSQEIF